ncbi:MULTISPECIES: restriction endonuclease subunit S [Marinobacter]|uniref:Restriction endonuclease subunit S n=1 Tax=Marinobacter daepoensis TaxID=262077 RepID=A0ABS3BDD3_9GAMM|nr:restriction endonuclease subunit S [Marinobacter daepoensis]MBN7769834.1 restriction endonuclease subunit S [Marinobacter daepoensis]MBY6080222.1 restriction endonuclease subunit S [Marinobacter daepoensis]
MSNAVPAGWSDGTLTDFCDINPRLAQRAEMNADTPVSFIKMEDVSNNAVVRNVRVAPYGQVSKGFTSFQNGDVLVAKITPCFENGKGGFVQGLRNGVGFGSTEFHVLRARKDSNSEFLYQFTNSEDFRLKGEANMTGSAGQRRVPTEYLKTLDVIFPPLPEQQKIAAILSSVDDVIEKTRAQIDKLKHLKTGMMQELLTKGIGSGGVPHTEFKDSPVGRIPVCWEVRKADDISDAIMVGVVIKPTQYYVDQGVPALRSANVRENGLTMDNLKYFSAESNDRLHKSKLRKGDLLTVRTGYPGTTAVVTKEFEGCNCIDVVITRPSAEMDSDFLCLWVNSDHGKGQVLKAQGGLAQQHFNVGDMKNLLVPVPPLAEQQAIFRAVDSVTRKLSACEKRLGRFNSLKKALMQDLLTGKVRVSTRTIRGK